MADFFLTIEFCNFRHFSFGINCESDKLCALGILLRYDVEIGALILFESLANIESRYDYRFSIPKSWFDRTKSATPFVEYRTPVISL